jgi:RNA polymerase sigma-70 factor, ECF subfamily
MDDQYLQLVLDGDAAKFAWFVDRYKGMAFSIAYRIVNNREDAEEIVQDAFLKAFRSLGKFRRGSKFSTWFYRIVVNTSLSKVRNVTMRPDSLDENEIGSALVENVESTYLGLELSEQKAMINEALQELCAEDRLLLTLYYLNENSIEEITEITGIIRENVKMKLHRARNRLYKVMNVKLKTEINSVLR